MKAQASVEFLVLFSLLVLIFIAFVYSNSSFQYSLIGTRTNVESKRLVDSVAFEINNAVRAGDGYKRRFYLDDSDFGFSNYTISVSNYSVFIDWSKGSSSSRIITQDVVGSFQKKWNIINNTNGVIYVN